MFISHARMRAEVVDFCAAMEQEDERLRTGWGLQIPMDLDEGLIYDFMKDPNHTHVTATIAADEERVQRRLLQQQQRQQQP